MQTRGILGLAEHDDASNEEPLLEEVSIDFCFDNDILWSIDFTALVIEKQKQFTIGCYL